MRMQSLVYTKPFPSLPPLSDQLIQAEKKLCAQHLHNIDDADAATLALYLVVAYKVRTPRSLMSQLFPVDCCLLALIIGPLPLTWLWLRV